MDKNEDPQSVSQKLAPGGILQSGLNIQSCNTLFQSSPVTVLKSNSIARREVLKLACLKRILKKFISFFFEDDKNMNF